MKTYENRSIQKSILTTTQKYLFTAELAICFGPLTIIVLTGLLLFPHQVNLLTSNIERNHEVSYYNIAFVFYFIASYAVAIPIMHLIRTIFSAREEMRYPYWERICVTLGILSFLFGPYAPFSASSLLIEGSLSVGFPIRPMMFYLGWLPLFGLLHCIYLEKRCRTK